jgi:hypothetical protein
VSSMNHKKTRLMVALAIVIGGASVASGLGFSGSFQRHARPKFSESILFTARGSASRPVSASRRAFLARRAAVLFRRRAKAQTHRHFLATALDPPTIAALGAAARSMSAMNGEATPSAGTVTTTSRQAAASLTGNATVDSNEQIFLVAIHGNFVGYLASVPAGSALPTGSTMTIAFEPSTLAVTDWTINTSPIDPSSLGPTVSLLLGT